MIPIRPIRPIHPDPSAGAGLFKAADARSVLAVQAFEAGGDSPLWTTEDRAWATRLARETGAAAQPPATALAARARHALQRLQPRQPALERLLKAADRLPAWAIAVPLLAFAAGLAVDAIGGAQRINLLAPPVWAVIAWNLLVYLALLLPARVWPRAPRVKIAAFVARAFIGPGSRPDSRPATGGNPPLQAFAAAWARATAPAVAQRVACLLHLGAAALALGLIAGLYMRGLVLDYRVAWQSTFLDPATVHAVLSALLAPASALTGIAVPDTAAITALRIGPDTPSASIIASAGAAPWIHLYAAMLALFVLLPRALLAAAAGWRARRLASTVPLPLSEPYFQRLLRDLQGRAAQVQVLPHGAAPSAQATLGLRDWLSAACGEGMQLRIAGPLAYGSEDDLAALQPLHPAPGTSLRVLLVDLGSTPEADSHGRMLQSLRAQQPALPWLVLTDEAGFRRRFASMPARLAERRATWQAWARAKGAGWVGVDLDSPALEAAEKDLQHAMRGLAATT